MSESEFQGLEKLATNRFEQFEKHADEKFKQIGNQLEEMNSRPKGLDELLRGNKENSEA